MLPFTISIVQSAVTCETGRLPSHKPIYFGSFHVSLSLLLIAVKIKWFNVDFTRDLPLASQSNI